MDPPDFNPEPLLCYPLCLGFSSSGKFLRGVGGEAAVLQSCVIKGLSGFPMFTKFRVSILVFYFGKL